jgi:hypothetical protein
MACWIVGLLLVLTHFYCWWRADDVRASLKNLPRSKTAGTVLIIIAAVWSFWLIWTIDLGEFTDFRRPLLILIPVTCFLCVKYLDEFLAVRALGMLALLVAEPLLEAAFLRPEIGRLLLVALAYVWVVLGMFWVGMPFVLRDQIDWLTRSPGRWRALCAAGLLYGLALLIWPGIPHR